MGTKIVEFIYHSESRCLSFQVVSAVRLLAVPEPVYIIIPNVARYDIAVGILQVFVNAKDEMLLELLECTKQAFASRLPIHSTSEALSIIELCQELYKSDLDLEDFNDSEKLLFVWEQYLIERNSLSYSFLRYLEDNGY